VTARLFLVVLLGILPGCTEEYEAVFGDPAAAAHRRWLAEDEQECEHGDGKACAKMADRYREGSEVAKDPDRAITYLRKACDFGDRSACNDLAQTLAGSPKGASPGAPADPAEAARLFEQLCSRGDPVGCYNRAVMFINGQGERQSYQAAVPWLKKACTPKYKSGCDTLQELRDKRLVREDVGRFGAATPPRRATLATSDASYAVELRRWFPDEIRVPFPYSPHDIPVAGRNLCNASEVQASASGDSMLVAGRLAVAALPSGLRAAKRSGQPGKYRLLAVGYVVLPDGGAKWAGEVIGSEAVWTEADGTARTNFSLVIARPKARGETLLIVVSGDPISVANDDQGGAVILGSYLRPL
jgi:hypothetical protein